MELCEHGNSYHCQSCEIKYLKCVIEEQQKEIAEWKEKEFIACSKHHEFIDEIERYEKALKEIIMLGNIGSKYESLESQLAKEALKE